MQSCQALLSGTLVAVPLKREKFLLAQVLQNGQGQAVLADVVAFSDAFGFFTPEKIGKPIDLPVRLSVRRDKRGEAQLSATVETARLKK